MFGGELADQEVGPVGDPGDGDVETLAGPEVDVVRQELVHAVPHDVGQGEGGAEGAEGELRGLLGHFQHALAHQVEGHVTHQGRTRQGSWTGQC